MKKFLLSFFVIFASIIYVLSQKISNNSPQVKTVSTNFPSTNSNNSLPPNNMGNNSQGNSPYGYKDGTYTGTSADAYYGNIQVQAVIQNGKISDIQFLDYPKDRNTSVTINSQAMQILKTEAIRAQSAQVDIVSGATPTSQAFQESLASALSQAQM